MIRQYLARFMVGRYGMDALNGFLMVVYLVCLVLSLFTRNPLFNLLTLVLVVITCLRMYSRNLSRRRQENARFLQLTRPLLRRFQSFQQRVHDKEHRYFRCPNCGQEMRVPRGKGRITVHCRSCGATFEERS